MVYGSGPKSLTEKSVVSFNTRSYLGNSCSADGGVNFFPFENVDLRESQRYNN